MDDRNVDIVLNELTLAVNLRRIDEAKVYLLLTSGQAITGTMISRVDWFEGTGAEDRATSEREAMAGLEDTLTQLAMDKELTEEEQERWDDIDTTGLCLKDARVEGKGGRGIYMRVKLASVEAWAPLG